MTGGQPVDGPISVATIAHTVRAEGVARIALVSDDPTKFHAADFPAGVTIQDRGALDAVQRELRQVPGVSVLIYEQACATEKRRRRKRGTVEDPKRFAFINALVCEGCGDCSVESNCPQRRTEGDALRAKAQDQSVDLQQGLHLPERLLSELRYR